MMRKLRTRIILLAAGWIGALVAWGLAYARDEIAHLKQATGQ
jgi:hypothetical protein